MSEGAFNTTFMTGDDYAKWVDTKRSATRQLMKEAGFLAGNDDAAAASPADSSRRRLRTVARMT